MNNEEKILSMLAQIQSDMSDMKAAQAEQGDRLSRLETKVDKLETSVGKLETKVGKIEDMQEELRTAVNRVALKQEQDVVPYVKLLDEDHADIRQKLPEKSQVEALEKDMRLVKTSVKNHAQRISALEKAN